MEDPRPRLTHEIDQFQAAIRDLAPVFATFHARLIAEGMQRPEATAMSQTLLQEMYREAQHG